MSTRFRAPRCWPPALRWAVLVSSSAALATALEGAGLPAGLLMGPMLAAVVLAGLGAGFRVPALPVFAAQAAVGLMIANMIPGSLFGEVGRRWPVFAGGVLSVIGLAAVLGGVLARLRVLDGTTAVWGSMPGAATVMTLMAESFGADMRMVAVMQYLRVLCVVLATTVASGLMGAGGGGGAAGGRHWFETVAAGTLAETVALAAAAAAVGVTLRVPAGALIVPMLAGLGWKDGLGLPLALPPILLAVGYAVVGWTIGQRFGRTVLGDALRALPRVLGSIALLIGSCAAVGWVLHRVAGVSPLTAYLATSPGGADSVAIIAASTPVDVPFVMAMQVCRFGLMLVVGPALARMVARGVERGAGRGGRRSG